MKTSQLACNLLTRFVRVLARDKPHEKRALVTRAGKTLKLHSRQPVIDLEELVSLVSPLSRLLTRYSNRVFKSPSFTASFFLV